MMSHAITAIATDPKSLDAFLTRGLGGGWKLEFTASAGLSEANPDYAAGIGFIWRSSERR